jgi:16S rRNA (cytosine1402-N4)-methyltransferase
MPYHHVPVMVDEVLAYLNVQPGKTIVDCTLGGCGHAKAILERTAPDGFLIGLDQDIEAIENAQNVLTSYNNRISLFHDNFVNLPSILDRLGIIGVDGILLDLGVSLHHLESSGRGFSFRKNEPLDMRMDVSTKITAEQVVNTFKEKELAHIFSCYGEERFSKRIARAIVRERKKTPIRTSYCLAEIIRKAIPKQSGPQRIHPATRVFMSLRIYVNSELEKLEIFMKNVADLLTPRGRLCVLSFHSLEDRIVKHQIRALGKTCSCPPSFSKCICGFEKKFRSLTKKPLRPTGDEISANPNARSTRLRAAERI